MKLSVAFVLSAFAAFCLSDAHANAALLIGNSEGNNVVIFDEQTGNYLGDFIAPGSGGLAAPDDLTYGPDGDLYVSSGYQAENSAVLRYDGTTGVFKGTFASGNGLFRPYGSAFGPDGNLYVSSFLSDQILRYDGKTGEFVDVFASGDGLSGGLNGPNDLLFGTDGSLYVTTQGSVAGSFPGLPSQVLRFSPGSTTSTVFVDQPEPSFGFISFLGLVSGTENDIFVSDFANDIRRYDSQTGALVQTLSTNYTGTISSDNFLGNLTFGPDDTLYSVGFDFTNDNLGAILRYDGVTGAPLPSDGNTGPVFVSTSEQLMRPIGITYTSEKLIPVPEPTSTVGLLATAAFGILRWKRKYQPMKSKPVE